MKNVSLALHVLNAITIIALTSANKYMQLNCSDQYPMFTKGSTTFTEKNTTPTHLASRFATISFDLANMVVSYTASYSATLPEYLHRSQHNVPMSDTIQYNGWK
jgi:hypothetical protein